MSTLVKSLVFGVVVFGFAPARAAEHASQPFSLVDARLDAVQDISGESDAPRISCDKTGQLCFDGSFRLTFKVLRTLAGPKVKGPLFDKQASAQPVTGRRYLVVVSSGKESDGSVVWTGAAKAGLCAEPAEISWWELEGASAKFPCKD